MELTAVLKFQWVKEWVHCLCHSLPKIIVFHHGYDFFFKREDPLVQLYSSLASFCESPDSLSTAGFCEADCCFEEDNDEIGRAHV